MFEDELESALEAFDSLRNPLMEEILYDGLATEVVSSHDFRLKISAQWHPKQRVRWLTDFEKAPHLLNRSSHKFVLREAGMYRDQVVETIVENTNLTEATGWIETDRAVGNLSKKVRRARVRWLNLGDIGKGGRLKFTNNDGSWQIWSGLHTWRAGPWELEIHERPDLSHIVRQLKDSEGVDVTHVAELKRRDGNSFTYSECADALLAFQLAASFCVGHFACPSLAEGIDETGQAVWREWIAKMVGPLSSSFTWWHWAAGEISEPVRLVVESFLNPLRRTAVQFTIQSYLACCSGGFVEQRVSTAFSAIERLSWQISVIEGGADPDRHDRKTAAQKIRALLTACNAPLTVPHHLPKLSNFARTNSLDAAQALAAVRNKIIHPKAPEDLYETPGLVAEAWLLALHFLDLFTLYWLGYEDKIANRSILNRWAGDVEPVPWSS